MSESTLIIGEDIILYHKITYSSKYYFCQGFQRTLVKQRQVYNYLQAFCHHLYKLVDITFAIFRLSGKQPVYNDLLKISHNGKCMLSITALYTLEAISSYTGLLVDTKALTILFILSSLVGLRTVVLLISFFYELKMITIYLWNFVCKGRPNVSKIFVKFICNLKLVSQD